MHKIHLPYDMSPAAPPSALVENERLDYGQRLRTRIGELPHLNYCVCCLVAGRDCSPASMFHRVGSVVHCLMTLWCILLKVCAAAHDAQQCMNSPQAERTHFFMTPPLLVACLQLCVHSVEVAELTTWCFLNTH